MNLQYIAPSVYKGIGVPGSFDLIGDNPTPGDLWVDLSVPTTKRLVSINPAVWISIEGSSTINFADGEVPGGAINGVNASFSLAHAPSPTASLKLYLNGVVQTQIADYSLGGAAITFNAAPLAGDALIAWYRY